MKVISYKLRENLSQQRVGNILVEYLMISSLFFMNRQLSTKHPYWMAKKHVQNERMDEWLGSSSYWICILARGEVFTFLISSGPNVVLDCNIWPSIMRKMAYIPKSDFIPVQGVSTSYNTIPNIHKRWNGIVQN